MKVYSVHDGTRRCMVAAGNQKEAARLLGTTLYYMREDGGIVQSEAAKLALAEPGKVWVQRLNTRVPQMWRCGEEVAFSERPTTVWVKVIPVAEGWYWFRDDIACTASIVKVWLHSGELWAGMSLLRGSLGEWWGPIQEPGGDAVENCEGTP